MLSTYFEDQPTVIAELSVSMISLWLGEALMRVQYWSTLARSTSQKPIAVTCSTTDLS